MTAGHNMAKKRTRETQKPTRSTRRARLDRPLNTADAPRAEQSVAAPAVRKRLVLDPTSVPGERTVIVGVGASAGGLEAFSEILSRLPTDLDLAVIFVQHLSPQHESSLPALLAAKSPLPVVPVTDRMDIRPNRVHVMPPNVQLEVVDGRLHILPRPHDRSQFTPIDFLFESLARWAQDAAIGVLLSGTGSDGVTGLREIKAAGGITMAQKPETAKYDGMPRSAISAGAVDLVLSPREIAEHLQQVRQHAYMDRRRVDEAVPDQLLGGAEALRAIFMALRRASGIDFTQYKIGTVRRRLLRRMALHRLTEITSYLKYLREQPSEASALAQDLLIHVTRFFREPESFQALAAHALPEIVHERSSDPIRIWVPGCATGEEAYSVAITLTEFLADPAAERRVQIFATDVSETAIEVARAGLYPLGIAADVSADRLARFFEKSDSGYRVTKALRDMCVFARHDLSRDPPFSRLDLIVCRNVMIYLDLSLQKHLLSVFHYALKPQGFLMVGAAETAGAQGPFRLVDKKARLYKQLKLESAPPIWFQTNLRRQTPLGKVPGKPPRPEGRPVQEEANRVVLDKYGPASVIVDSGFQIVQFRGHTGPYLEAASGVPNLDILKMARGGLLHPLRIALQAVRRRGRHVRKEGVFVQRNGEWREINLEVIPLVGSNGDYFLVLFEEVDRGNRKGARPAPKRKPPPGEESRVGDLRRELAASREYLQAIVQELEAANEDLQSANEEILSSNEELQSTNEELDTAKEELQSTNEELNTVNEELHSRNEELTRVNSDLVNLLASVEFPIVMVDNDLRIRRFTPKAEVLFNMIPGDVGRRLGQISSNLLLDDLERLIRETIETLVPAERDVQDRAGRWFSLRVRPYKSLDNRLDGAVVTAIDVDAAKRHERQTQLTGNYFKTIVETVRDPLLVLDADLRVRTANRSFCRMYGVSASEAEGRLLYEIGNGEFNTAQLRGMLDDMAAGRPAADVTIEDPSTQAGARPVVVNARQIDLGDAASGILLAFGRVADAETTN
jgi:two-component system CheB/CheR fusion protein